MKARSVTVEALILRVVPYGEADLVVHLLARGRGRVGAFARGARRSVRRFAGGLEPFSLVSAEFAERRGGELVDLKSATVLDAHLGIRGDLDRIAHAGYATELTRELLREAGPNDELFALLLGYLRLLGRGKPRSLCLRAFEVAALDAAGLAPVLEACARCGQDVFSRTASWFDPEMGGAACGACRGSGALPFDRASLTLLVALRSGGLLAAEGAEETGLPLDRTRLALRAFIDHHVRRGLRSLAFLQEVGAPA